MFDKVFERIGERLFPRRASQVAAERKFDASVTQAYNVFRNQTIQPLIELAVELSGDPAVSACETIGKTRQSVKVRQS